MIRRIWKWLTEPTISHIEILIGIALFAIFLAVFELWIGPALPSVRCNP